MSRNTLVVVAALSLFTGACAKKTYPQKGETKSLHSRLYFEYRECDWSQLKYLGHAERSSFDEINPSSVPADTEKKMVALKTYDASGKVLSTSYAPNPTLLQSSDNRYAASTCQASFFVDVPVSVDIATVASISINDEVTLTQSFRDPVYTTNLQLDANNQIDRSQLRVMKLVDKVPAEQGFDLVILGDGFTQEQAPINDDAALRASAFGKAAQSMADALVSVEPYKSLKDKINVWIVATPSVEEGADFPSKGVVRNTFYDSTFGGDCVDRALIVREALKALEVASETPFDQALMLVNSRQDGGTGGVIPTVALSDDFAATLIHELGHSVGLLSDNYSYFSDDLAVSTCKDSREKDQLEAIDPSLAHGKNDLSDDENEIAPNLTLKSTIELAKWSDLLTPESNVVNFVYPGAQGKLLEDGKSVSWSFKTDAPLANVHLYSGLRTDISRTVLSGNKITINTQEVGTDKIRIVNSDPPDFSPAIDARSLAYFKGTKFVNWHTDLPETIPAGDVTVTIHYPYPDMAEDAVGQSWAAHSLMLASKEFDVRGVGLYQGAGPSLDKVWRSSFTSMMATLEYDLDAVERKALSTALDRYIPETK